MLQIHRDVFEFITPAKTSRGEYKSKNHYRLVLQKDGKEHTGEIAPLPDLSLDGQVDYLDWWKEMQDTTWESLQSYTLQNVEQFPALAFAVDSINLSLKSEKSPFENGKPIAINGLVWMNNLEQMRLEALQKAQAGFECIKFKVGALDHDGECKLIESLRNDFPRINIRLDANGAFSIHDYQERIKDFSKFQIHSIEQPIKAGTWQNMQEVCAKSLIDVALDEELIGVFKNKENLLNTIKPRYIVLKPTLLGGFTQCNEWINAAQKRDILWWATSALEGNIGLLSIAKWISNFNTNLHQGLGTGSLYKSNYKAQFKQIKDNLIYEPQPI